MHFYECQSHPDILLIDHLIDVGSLIQTKLIKLFSSNFPINPSIVANVGFLIGIFHDFGKCTQFFQDHLLNKTTSIYSYHSYISAFIGSEIVKNYITLHISLNNNDKLD